MAFLIRQLCTTPPPPAQEHADLKLRAGELRLREEMAAKERAELEREKEKLSTAALHLKTRAQEMEAFSKVRHGNDPISWSCDAA